MHNVLLMCVIESFGGTFNNADHLAHLHQVIGLAVTREIVSLEKLHGNKSEVVFFAGIVDGDNVGMIKSTCGFRFTKESCFNLLDFVRIEFFRQRHGFDCYNPANLGIFA